MARKVSRIKTNIDILFYLLVMIGIGQLVYYYPLLPETVASHFSSDGDANGWLNKQGLMIVYGVILLVLYLVFYMSGKFNLEGDQKYLSLPNKDYWLQDIRRVQAAEFIARKGVYFSFYTLGFLLIVMQMVFEANLADQVIFNSEAFIFLLLLYGLYVIIWSMGFINFFRKIE